MNFKKWCLVRTCNLGLHKFLYLLTAKRAKRARARRKLVPIIRSHYHDLDQIANDVARLGYQAASKLLQTRTPNCYKSQAGDLGEILGVELFEAYTKFRIPIKRLRYKDHRNAPLRGDDIIGLSESDNGAIQLLKAEAKSRVRLRSTDINNARHALVQNDGLPAPHSLLFIADRLLEAEGADKQLGQRLRDDYALDKIKDTATTHGLSVLYENSPSKLLIDDLIQVESEHDQVVVGMQITDLRAFITNLYEEVSDLGNS